MPRKLLFAPLPVRAIGDKRLTELHLRVLAAISYHDRLSASRQHGQGCWASNLTLAEEVGCNYTNLSTAITDLGRFGYLERHTHPLDKRKKVLRVVQGEEPPTRHKMDPSSSKQFASGQSTPRDRSFASGQTTATRDDTDRLPEATKVVCPPSDQAIDTADDPVVNIFRETENTLHRNGGRYSPEGAPIEGIGAHAAADQGINIGAQLAQIERRMKLKKRRLPEHERAAMRRLFEKIIDDNLDFEDATYQRAERLLAMLDDQA